MSENPQDQNQEMVPEKGQDSVSASPDTGLQKTEDSEKAGEEHTGEELEVKTQGPTPLEDMKFGPGLSKDGGRVCITYGRDQIMNKQVVSLIRELGINPVIMQDTAHIKKPIAQFYTENPEISFVVAILSADDWVYPKNGKPKDALMYCDQGVVFHLGFWIGRLGRNRVFALFYDQRSFRWPTEHFDVIYTPLDKNGIWKTELVSRLAAGGIQFNTQQK